MSSRSTLLLFTQNYPFGTEGEAVFLRNEIQYLASGFEKIVVVPRRMAGDRVELPGRVVVEEGYVRHLRSRGTLAPAIRGSGVFQRELRLRPEVLFQPHSFRRLYWSVAGAVMTREWLQSLTWLRPSDTLAYTYWLCNATLGLGLFRNLHPELVLVSRAHGGDLYECRHSNDYIPGRAECLGRVDRVYCISDDGRAYLSTRYPSVADRVEVSRLGVESSGASTPASSDGVTRMVSCSFLVRVKRVALLLDGVAELGRRHPESTFEWTHIGDGPEMPSVRAELARLPSNCVGVLLGSLPNDQVLSLYRKGPWDVFINVSASEGVPVAIMEAMSHGIPAVATAVGGSPELVSSDNGVLLPSDPNPGEIADGIWAIVQDSRSSQSKRMAGQRYIRDKYDAHKNFQDFVARLREL
jgi:colanic acid/amylovoran biosynthesis glycosyltransferase